MNKKRIQAALQKAINEEKQDIKIIKSHIGAKIPEAKQWLKEAAPVINYLQSNLVSKEASSAEIENIMNKLKNFQTAELIQKGYELIMETRKSLTGINISYLVAVIDDEGKLSSETLLDNILTSNLTRESIQSDNSVQLRPNIRPKIPVDVQQVTAQSKKMWLLFCKSPAIMSFEKKINTGVLYEAFCRVRAKGITNFYQNIPDIQAIIQDASSNNTPFYKAGDIGSIQIKAFNSGSPSLATFQTIVSVLKKYLAYCSIPNQKIKEAALKQLFSTTSTKQLIENLNAQGEKISRNKFENTLKESLTNVKIE